MRLSDGESTSSSAVDSRPKATVDWRGWLILAWVIWSGSLYAKMVVEQRAHRFREILKGPARVGQSNDTTSRR